MEEQRGYARDRQSKAPDFVLEVASPTTGRADYTVKRRDYERFGVTEYWRFDPSGGEYHDAALAGDLLAEGVYQPIEIEVLGEGRLRGYSDALGLYVCWEDGMLRFFDPVSESYLDTHEEERSARLAAQARAREEEAARLAAQTRAGTAENRAETAETRARGEGRLVWRLKPALRKSGPVAWRRSHALRSLKQSFDACAANRSLPSPVHRQPDQFPRPPTCP